MLRKKTTKIPAVTKEVQKLINDMHDTLKEAKGLGIAAPQVGSSLRVCLAKIGKKTMVLVNPQITWKSDDREIMEEGCLSLPGLDVEVERPIGIIVEYLNEKGKPEKRKLSSIDARVVQHEVDHLEGVLIVDYLPSITQLHPAHPSDAGAL